MEEKEREGEKERQVGNGDKRAVEIERKTKKKATGN